MITRAIGLQRNVEIDVLRLDITPGDLLLLCSDGLNSMITDEEILAVILGAQPDSICNDLIDAANKAGGHDNITVITAQF